MTQFAIVILAAGKGTRLNTRRPKMLHEVGGKALLRHVVDAARQIVQPNDIYVIVGHQAEEVKKAAVGVGVNFIPQTEQRGTGHAIQQAQPAVAGYEHFLTLSGDAPLIRPETIARLRDFHLAQRAAMSVLTACPPDPQGYGRVLRKKDAPSEVDCIVEQRALTQEQERIREINAGIYAFASRILFAHIGELQANNAQGELYLTDMAAILRRAGERVAALEAEDAAEVLGANTIAEMMELDAALRLRTARRLMQKGVTVFRPETTVIDAEVEVGPDTVIEPFVQLLGQTRIGENCRIRSFSVLEDTVLGDGTLVRNGCNLEGSEIGRGAAIGPYTHLRAGSVIGDGAHLGNFVEVKNTRLGNNSKANHLAYLGDAEIGSAVNVGAGVITCNYDGYTKSRTTIGDGAFVGSDATLIAPVHLGQGSYIGAGSCITEDVPQDALAVERSAQVVKEGWALKRRIRKSREA
jgi:bifunctional UDP-N-acetylglucosamine pyrophosphorylase/glucosamine-1-phosphate N-acetyltransferase